MKLGYILGISLIDYIPKADKNIVTFYPAIFTQNEEIRNKFYKDMSMDYLIRKAKEINTELKIIEKRNPEKLDYCIKSCKTCYIENNMDILINDIKDMEVVV